MYDVKGTPQTLKHETFYALKSSKTPLKTYLCVSHHYMLWAYTVVPCKFLITHKAGNLIDLEYSEASVSGVLGKVCTYYEVQ